MQKKYANKDELAQLLGVDASRIDIMLKKKGSDAIPRIKIGQKLVFDLDAVGRWFADLLLGPSILHTHQDYLTEREDTVHEERL